MHNVNGDGSKTAKKNKKMILLSITMTLWDVKESPKRKNTGYLKWLGSLNVIGNVTV